MTDEHNDKLTGLLARAVQQMVETPRSNEPPADLDATVLQELSRLDESSDRSSLLTLKHLARQRMSSFTKYTVVAAIVIVTGMFTWLGLANETNSVYGAVAERLRDLHSVVYRVQWVDEAGLVNAVAGDGDKVIYVAPSHHRIESTNGPITIVDTDAEKAIRLLPATKTALVMSGRSAIHMAMRSRRPVALIETLQKHFRVDREPPARVEELGSKEIGGIAARGLRSTIDGEIVEVWIDPTTNLPVEVRIRHVIPAHVSGSANGPTHMWRIMSALEYDVRVDPLLMSVEVPEDYAVITMPEPPLVESAAAPSLSDVIELLRLCAEHNDGTFPKSLSMNDTPGSCMAIMKEFADSREEAITSGSDAEKQAALEAVMEFGRVLGRGTAFLLSMRPDKELRYFGDGVTLGTAERPIMWFSPKGGGQYQVVYADLSVQTVEKANLPSLPAAARSKLEDREDRTVIRSIAPRVVLPRSAVTDYGELQRIREAGRQEEVRFLELQWMRELIAGNDAAIANYDPEVARFQFLAEFSNLEGLRVDHLFLTEKDLKVIGGLDQLRKLSLSGVQIIEESGETHRLRGAELRHLSELRNLEMLDLSQSDFGGGLRHLRALPKLNTLILSSFENLNDASVSDLKQLPYLETLVLAPAYGKNPKTTVTEAGLKSLKELPSLRTLYVGYHGEWTLPVKKLQQMLPNVNVQAGFQKETQGGPDAG